MLAARRELFSACQNGPMSLTRRTFISTLVGADISWFLACNRFLYNLRNRQVIVRFSTENTPPYRPRQNVLNALILAAGQGRRLWPYTSECPKCLLDVGPHTILKHQLLRLAAVGVTRVTIVAGYGLDAMREEASGAQIRGLSVQVIYNPFYAVADNLISLWAARAEMGTDFLVLNGDNVFHPDIPRFLLGPPASGCRLLIQRQSHYSDDDMKVCLDEDRLLQIGKDLPPRQTHATSIGMMRFSGTGAAALHQVLEEAVRGDEALGSFYLDCVQRLADAGTKVCCHDVGSLPCVDIDTPQDLQSVRSSLQIFEPDFGTDFGPDTIEPATLGGTMQGLA